MAAELIFTRAVLPETTYTFKHALVPKLNLRVKLSYNTIAPYGFAHPITSIIYLGKFIWASGAYRILSSYVK